MRLLDELSAQAVLTFFCEVGPQITLIIITASSSVRYMAQELRLLQVVRCAHQSQPPDSSQESPLGAVLYISHEHGGILQSRSSFAITALIVPKSRTTEKRGSIIVSRVLTKLGRFFQEVGRTVHAVLDPGTGSRSFKVSGGGERRDRFGVVVGEGVVEPRIEGRFARRVGAGMHAHPPLARARDGAGCAR